MRQWYRDGMPIDERDLGDLAARDGEALCECGGLHFRFTAETIAGHPVQPAPRHSAAVVLTLRQIDRPQTVDPIYLVEFTDAGSLGATRCAARQCERLADALEIADRTGRRYVCAELFHKAEGLIAGARAA